MPRPRKLLEKFTSIIKPAGLVYPIIIIISIPLLLIFNTIRNLNYFNRDVNHLIRRQAVSISNTLKPIISENLDDTQKLNFFLTKAVESNDDLISAAVLKQEGTNLNTVTSTDQNFVLDDSAVSDLGGLAVGLGFDQSFAGLNYDPYLQKNVWDVIVPLEKDESSYFLLATKIRTDAVDELLSRTSRDSIVILIILIVVTIALLANHFLFYRKAMETRQLEELDRLKDEFISMASHDLQAPVGGLIGYLDLLKDKITPEKNPELQDELNTLVLLTNDLKNLIGDLLDVSRIEQGRIKAEIKEVQINDVIEHAVDTLKLQAEKKGVKIIFEKVDLPQVQSDPDRMRQVLTNLLSNSLKYTLQGQVTITTKVKGKFIEVSLADTGIGIPPDQLEKLFSKFHRVKDEKTKEVRGTGLGLWITKKIVELLGGKIYVESIYGTGTTMTFTVPLS